MQETEFNPCCAQLATYPGFNPHCPTSLPHGLDTMEQMKRVTSAQTKLSTKVYCFFQESRFYAMPVLKMQLTTYRRIWCKLFYSQASQAIFLDYFWWFFLHKYQASNKEDERRDLEGHLYGLSSFSSFRQTSTRFRTSSSQESQRITSS